MFCVHIRVLHILISISLVISLSLSFSDHPILLFMNSTFALSLSPSVSLNIYISISQSIVFFVWLSVLSSVFKCWNNNESWSSKVHATHTSIYQCRSIWNDCWFRACEEQRIEKGCPRIEIQEAKTLFSQETQIEKKAFRSGNIANWNYKLKLLVFLSAYLERRRRKERIMKNMWQVRQINDCLSSIPSSKKKMDSMHDCIRMESKCTKLNT